MKFYILKPVIELVRNMERGQLILPHDYLSHPYKHLESCGVGLSAGSGGIVVAGAAAYLCPAVRWRTTGCHEDGQHGVGQPPLSSQ